MRDSQRSKVYKSENATPMRNETPMSFEETIAFVRKIEKSNYWLDHNFDAIRPLEIADGRGTRQAYAEFWYKISLPKWSRIKLVILHELAHIAISRTMSSPTEIKTVAAHGREFCKVYLGLVRHYMGKKAHDELRDSFKAHRVKYKDKKQLSPETLAKLRERGKLLAASKQRDA